MAVSRAGESLRTCCATLGAFLGSLLSTLPNRPFSYVIVRFYVATAMANMRAGGPMGVWGASLGACLLEVLLRHVPSVLTPSYYLLIGTVMADLRAMASRGT